MQTTKTNEIRKGEAGFSLIELMVSSVIFLIFMGAVYGVLRMGTIQKTTTNTQTEIIKNMRLSLNTVGRDAVNAGLGYSRVGGFVPDNLTNLRLGLPADPDSSQDLITGVVSGNDINTNTLLPVGKTDVITFTYRDMDFNAGTPIELSSVQDNSGAGVKILTPAAAAYNVQPFDLYLISDGTRTALGLVTSVPNSSTMVFATGGADPLNINAPYTGSADTRSKIADMDFSNRVTAKKVIWVSYHVSADGTLIRTIYGNNSGQPATAQIQQQPIAYNVQNFQIKYLLTDGTVSDDPSNAGVDQVNLNDVVQIDVTVSAVISIRENGVNMSNVVKLTSTFSTKNLNYDID
ncbi:MAG: prepilin-type N-terminal cleavage/methylation domain-containing protein [Pyrinomonadaceae bacterium]